MNNPWPADVRTKATNYASKHGAPKAAAKYGIPVGTIRGWISRAKDPERTKANSRRNKAVGRNLPRVAEAVGVEIPTTPGKRKRPEDLANGCYDMTDLALANISKMLTDGPINHHVLHALCGAVKIGAETGNLLSGRATSRPENIGREENKRAIIEKLTSDRGLAERALPLLAELSGNGNGHRRHTANN